MAKRKNRSFPDDYEEGMDTDEIFQDRPEEAADESRISTGTLGSLEDEPASRLYNSGDLVEDTGEPEPDELRFDRNNDYGGSEAGQSTAPDFSRGSGFLGGKLIGEPSSSSERSSEGKPEQGATGGFGYSIGQERNIKAALAERKSADASREAEESASKPGMPGMGGDVRDQGHDLGRREQVTGSQRFGRDVGSSGLSGSSDGFDGAGSENEDGGSGSPV